MLYIYNYIQAFLYVFIKMNEKLLLVTSDRTRWQMMIFVIFLVIINTCVAIGYSPSTSNFKGNRVESM